MTIIFLLLHFSFVFALQILCRNLVFFLALKRSSFADLYVTAVCDTFEKTMQLLFHSFRTSNNLYVQLSFRLICIPAASLA